MCSSTLITILTPTYNRAYILPRLYQSLTAQSDKSFEWYIIDDGSDDNTQQLVLSWMALTNNPFIIRYDRKENGGKHRAVNFAIPRIHTQYTFIVDSDDYLTSNAIKVVNTWIKSIENTSNFAGVAGLRGYSEKQKIGNFPSNILAHQYIDAYNTERSKKRLTGDKAEIYKTNLLLQNPFPEFEGEKFLTESVVWNKLALDGYKIRWFNTIIYITEYLPDGLTQNLSKNRLKNFKGYSLEIEMEMRTKEIHKYRYLGRYIIQAKKRKMSGDTICAMTNISMFNYLIGYTVAQLQILFDKIKGRKNV